MASLGINRTPLKTNLFSQDTLNPNPTPIAIAPADTIMQDPTAENSLLKNAFSVANATINTTIIAVETS